AAIGLDGLEVVLNALLFVAEVLEGLFELLLVAVLLLLGALQFGTFGLDFGRGAIELFALLRQFFPLLAELIAISFESVDLVAELLLVLSEYVEVFFELLLSLVQCGLFAFALLAFFGEFLAALLDLQCGL